MLMPCYSLCSAAARLHIAALNVEQNFRSCHTDAHTSQRSATINNVDITKLSRPVYLRPEMQPLFRLIERVARTDCTVLVRGESGSGKELVARAIHTLSTRRQRPFRAINCATLSPTLLESELFGHVCGAFTGAISNHDGLFKVADTGTLFLDEVAEISLEIRC
jgi:transcriptional regulator with GAF, ATPase, and Fis domain